MVVRLVTLVSQQGRDTPAQLAFSFSPYSVHEDSAVTVRVCLSCSDVFGNALKENPEVPSVYLWVGLGWCFSRGLTDRRPNQDVSSNILWLEF